MRLKDSDEAYVEAAVEVLSASVEPAKVNTLAAEIDGRALDTAVRCSVRHRALADAEQERADLA
jgi:ribosomal protein L12E/L44/L45/RPP1/RPP2